MYISHGHLKQIFKNPELKGTYQLNSTGNDIIHSFQGGCIWQPTGEVSHDASTMGQAVPACCMGSLIIPASTLIYSAIFSHQEVVANVWPAWVQKNMYLFQYGQSDYYCVMT